MFSRMWGPAIVLFWLAAMSWLFWHDVWPVWSAREPPRAVQSEWIQAGRAQEQARIEDKYGNRVGTLWTVYNASGPATVRTDVILLERFPALSPARIEIVSQFDPHGRLDELTVDVYVPGLRIGLHGERFGSDLAFELTAGPVHQTFKMADVDAGMIGDMFKPFSAMPDLQVGQTWRMQVFNPVATVLGKGRKFIDMIVRVTGTRVLDTPDGRIECLIVQAPNARAWVARDGTVYMQEMELPIGGKITIRPEPFDDLELRRAKSMALGVEK